MIQCPTEQGAAQTETPDNNTKHRSVDNLLNEICNETTALQQSDNSNFLKRYSLNAYLQLRHGSSPGYLARL